MKSAPEQLQPQLREIFREHQGYEFDAERVLQPVGSVAGNAGTRISVTDWILEVDWPERGDDALRERLTSGDAE